MFQNPQQSWLALRVLALLIGLLGLVAEADAQAQPVPTTVPQTQNDGASAVQRLTSPDGRIEVVCSLAATEAGPSSPMFEVIYDGKPLVDPSRLGMTLREGEALATDVRVLGTSVREIDETWTTQFGKSAEIRDHFRELTVLLEQRSAPPRRLELVFRVYDDGVALRYRLPEQPALQSFAIESEDTHFAIAGDPRAYVLQLNSFTTAHESYYVVSGLDGINDQTLAGLPLLLEHSNGTSLAITEANHTDYAGMYLTGDGDASQRTLLTALSPRRDDPSIAVKGTTPHVSPWRVIMIGDHPGQLIESNLVVNLNEPSVIDDTSWIRPGQTTMPWLNGYLLDAADASPAREAPLNAQTMMRYIDFCAANGIEYHTLDGTEAQGAWYGGPIQPQGQTNVTRAIDQLELPKLLTYANEKGVRLRAWVHWKPLAAQLEEAFAQYEAWGFEGVMLDFMDRDDQEMVQFYHKVLETAAKHHLTVNFHGAYKPTGLRRTYPNLLTREAVFNLEHNKGFRFGVPPQHNLTVPFTRMLAGPLDYHQGVLRTLTPAAYRPIWHAPKMMGTPTHQLAMYVVYENYLPMVGDYPEAYEQVPGIDLIANMPVTWDETRVIDGVVGDLIVIARRKENTWYIGGMCANVARTVPLPLSFLGEGSFSAEIWADDPEAVYQPAATVRSEQTVTSQTTLQLRMAPAGGQVIRLTPARP